MRNEKPLWFVSRTRFGQELSLKKKLESRGVENFIPVRKDGKPAIRNLAFLKAPKKAALSLANDYGLPLHYMIDHSTGSLLVVPDKQMEDFIRVMDQSKDEGGLIDSPVAVGDLVKVLKGDLAGIEGNVLEVGEKTYIVVRLCDFLQAKAHIPRAWLEKI